MKKIISIVIIGILVLCGLGAAAFTTNDSLKPTMMMKNKSTSVLFTSQPVQLEKDGFIKLEMDGATTQLLEPNRPVLPIYVKTYEIPFGSTNIQVICNVKDINTMTLTKEIIPARIAPLSKINERTEYVKDSSVYESAAFYPDSWYSYDLGAGRNQDDQQVTFVKVVCYPVRYSPLRNQVDYADGFEISVKYDAPKTQPKALGASYDMVVIAPSAFESTLQPLIDFKNNKGVATVFKSMEEILAEYTGFDQPEQVKYFIKDAYEMWNITYVLLVGGLKSYINAKDKDTISAGWKAWWVPVRYVSMPMERDHGTLSDLYYGCLYNATGDFDSWDSNGDGVYAVWGLIPYKKDIIDLYPEVYVARLPCITVREVNVVVNKILTYESTGLDSKPWFKKFVGVAGKTFAMYEDQPDGEYLCDLSYSYLVNAIPDLEFVRCYSTNRDSGGLTPTTEDIIASINAGAGFVDFTGHGNPLTWNTIWFDGEYPNDWTGGVSVTDYRKILNGEKYPIVVVCACHNGLYNMSLIPCLKDKTGENYFMSGYWFPVGFSWGLVVKPRGGAIASTGCTGYSIGNTADPMKLSYGFDTTLFWQIGMKNVTHLGQAHGNTIQKFLSEEQIGQTEAYCLTEWALFGDPSLRFGGYSS